MTESTPQPERHPLPSGWDWADWDGRAEAEADWEALGKNRAKLGHRFDEIVAIGHHLPKEKVHYDQGIGKAKVKYPSPGWRACFFQDGNTRYVTHISLKDDNHDQEIEKALKARAEHMTRKKARAKGPK